MANTNQDNRWEIFSGPSKFNLVVPPFVEGHESPVSFHCKHNGEPHSRLDVVVSALVVQTSAPDPVEGTTYSYLFWGILSRFHRHNFVSPFVIGSYSPTERTGWLRLISPTAYLAVLATLGNENARTELKKAGYKLPQISSSFETEQQSTARSENGKPTYRVLKPITLTYLKEGQSRSHVLKRENGIILFNDGGVLKGTNGETRCEYTTPVSALEDWVKDGSIELN